LEGTGGFTMIYIRYRCFLTRHRCDQGWLG
jgi:hypothetical protein